MYPLQCSCLENPRDRGAWWAAVCGVAQSWTRLKWRSSSSSRCTTCLCICLWSKHACSVAQTCPAPRDTMDCSLPGSSVHGIFQARILEWVAISSSRVSSQPRDWTCVSCIDRWILYHWATWETCMLVVEERKLSCLMFSELLGSVVWCSFFSFGKF